MMLRDFLFLRLFSKWRTAASALCRFRMLTLGHPLRVADLLDHLRDDALSPHLPLGPVPGGVVQALVARDAEHVAVLELPGEGDDVRVEEVQFALVPERGGIYGHPPGPVRLVQFLEELPIPLAVHLEGVRKERGILELQEARKDDAPQRQHLEGHSHVPANAA